MKPSYRHELQKERHRWKKEKANGFFNNNFVWLSWLTHSFSLFGATCVEKATTKKK